MGQFDKFKKQGDTGAKKKEFMKQEKRKAKKETAEYFKEKRKEKKPGHIAIRPEAPGKTAGKKTGEAPASKSQPYASRAGSLPAPASTEIMPLNKYIAHSGLCSRRDAATMVKDGLVKVNGIENKEPGYKVLADDEVKVNGKKIALQQQLVYILLNKPKDFITTAEDDKGRKTVLDIVKNATTERIFPVGRLDRNTTGVLLLTNDGELTQHLTHPSFEVRKIYEVTLDKPVLKADLEKLIEGITLEDGEVRADAAGFADNKDKSVVGVEIHSGKNRVVRRMFESLGYDVKSLDRVMFANLTKKNVDRGKWRFLAEKEVRLLKFFNKSKRKINFDKIELQDAPFSGKSSTPSKSPKLSPRRSENLSFDRPLPETARITKPKSETYKSEGPMSSNSRAEKPRSEDKRSENTRDRTPRASDSKSAPPRSESTRSETPRSSNPRSVSQRSEVQRSSNPRSDDSRSSNSRSENTRSENPRSSNPRAERPTSEYQRARAPRSSHTRSENTRSENPRSSNSRSEKPRSEGQRSSNPRSDGSRSSNPRSENARSENPRSSNSRSEDKRFENPRSETPRSENNRSSGPRSEGRKSAIPRSETPRDKTPKDTIAKTSKRKRIPIKK